MEKESQYLKSALKLGLSGKAAKVYIYLLKEKRAMAPVEIIKSTNLHRQYVYDGLNELQIRGLVEVSGNGRGVKYFSHNPQKAISEFEQKKINAIDGAQKLMDLYRKTPPGMIEIVEGAEAVVENEIRLMKNQKLNSWLDIIGGAGTGFMELFNNRFNEYEEARVAKKCQVRYIGAKSDIKHKKNPKIRRRVLYESRYLDGIDNIVNVCIRPDTVSFNVYSPEVMVIRIKSLESVVGQKALFEILWKIANKQL